MLMESIGQDECLWFAPIQLFDSVLLSPINRKNEETLKVQINRPNLPLNLLFFSSIEIFNRW